MYGKPGLKTTALLLTCLRWDRVKYGDQFSSVAQSCLTLCSPKDPCQASLSITNSWSLLRLMSIELVVLSSHLILCHPLLLLPWIFPSNRLFSNESVLLIRWPKYWSFSFSISPSNEYLGLISFRTDWLDLLTAQGTLKSLLQHHSPKAWWFGRSNGETVGNTGRCPGFLVIHHYD